MDLPLVGQEIVAAALDGGYAVFVSTAGRGEVRLESAFELRTGDGAVTIDPQRSVDGPHLDRLAALVGLRIETVTADEETGLLRVRGEDGTELIAPADPLYEAWSVSTPGTDPVTALPGGALA